MSSIKRLILGVGAFVALFGIATLNLAVFGFGVLIAIIAFFFAEPVDKLEDKAALAPEPVRAAEPEKAPEPVKVAEPVQVQEPVKPAAPPVVAKPAQPEVKAPAAKPAAAKAQPAQPPKKRGRKPTKK